MTITEANYVNLAVRAMIRQSFIAPVTPTERKAALYLVERANKALGAGLRPEEVGVNLRVVEEVST